MHCRFDLAHPPRFHIEDSIAGDPVLAWLEASWRWQQLPLAALLWWLGGWAFVHWGTCLRITLSLTGHWVIGHFAHHGGHQGWQVAGLPVQGYNLPRFGLITFGEAFHGNHHAFPHSARLGIEPGQTDPGFWLIRALAWLGLARNIRLPSSAPPRDGLTRLHHGHQPSLANSHWSKYSPRSVHRPPSSPPFP